jgi:protein O-GlcNAc transferase
MRRRARAVGDRKLTETQPDKLLKRALNLHQAGRVEQAGQLYRQLLEARPDDADALHLLGLCCYTANQYGRAADLIRQSIAIAANNPVVLNNLGAVLLADRQPEAALDAIEKALSLEPGYADAWNNCGSAYAELRRMTQALTSYQRAMDLGYQSAPVHLNRGKVLQLLGQIEAARAEYSEALRLSPDYCDAWHDLGVLEENAGRFEQARHAYAQALRACPEMRDTAGHLLFLNLRCCDWQNLDRSIDLMCAAATAGDRVTEPFPLLVIPTTADQQLRAARAYTADKFPQPVEPVTAPMNIGRERLRIAYFSADFHDHATAHLLAGVLEQHDRNQLELLAFSFGPEANDPWRRRIVGALDRFIDVREKSDREIAALARSMEVDIAVDLKGFTKDARTGIFAQRAAPVQVNFLGYPGTMGAAFIDYLITDRVVVPTASFPFYREKIVWLPNSYQPNDSTRAIADHSQTRIEAGLPEDGFVFCCFNNTYKISSDVFDVWMNLLHQVPGSVLWLLEGNAIATDNLRREAAARGIADARLVFAPRLPLAEYLARYRLADLFLDTFHYNAHTTASDALWAGLPVLTRRGTTFASRVAASLLEAVGLPELIADTTKAYQDRAIELAGDHTALADLRTRLNTNRSTSPLFDCSRFSRNLEAAYVEMARRHRCRLEPDHIVVADRPTHERSR